MKSANRIRLYVNTVRYLKPGQICGKLRQRFPARTIRRKEIMPPHRACFHLSVPALDEDPAYVRRFVPEKILTGELTLLHRTLPAVYDRQTTAAWLPLYKYNLYYFEYAVALGAMYRRTKDVRYADTFLRLYQACREAAADTYPYVLSLQIPYIRIAMELFGEALNGKTEPLYQHLYEQYRYLLRHLETALLGNHYFENLKTIVLGSLLFQEEAVYRTYMKEWQKQIREQILPDGMHIERSALYHKILLEDVLRMTAVLQQLHREETPFFLEVCQKMLNAAVFLEEGLGRTPLFNDAGDNVAKTLPQLCAAAWDLFGIRPAPPEQLPKAGYYRLEQHCRVLLFDCGNIGPDYQPGHAHCDCLSFELSCGGVPLFVNSGTYQYQGGCRAFFRSTRAHNTAMAEGEEQSACWGEHRVAQRIGQVQGRCSGRTLTGSYRSMHGAIHRRTLVLDGKIFRVTDVFHPVHPAKIHSYLHLAPGFQVLEQPGQLDIRRQEDLVATLVPEQCTYIVHRSGELTQYAPDFGLLLHGICLEFLWDSDDREHGYCITFQEE